MPSFDIVNRVDLQEVDNAVNITKKAIISRYDFRNSKTEITIDKSTVKHSKLSFQFFPEKKQLSGI